MTQSVPQFEVAHINVIREDTASFLALADGLPVGDAHGQCRQENEQMTSHPQQASNIVIVEDRRGPGCIVGCLALVGLLVILGFVLFSCGILSLGAAATTVTPSTQPPPIGTGVKITRFTDDSIARAAGMQVGDVIVEYDGTAVSSTEDLRGAVASGDFTGRIGRVALTVKRNGQLIEFSVNPGLLGVYTE